MWGTADFLGGVASRRRPVLIVYGLSQLVGLVTLALVTTVMGAWGADPRFWPWAIGSGLLGIAGMVAFYRALALGPMGIVSPLVSVAVVIPVAVGLLRGEEPSSLALLGVAFAIVGILLASGPELTGAEALVPLALAAIAALAFGGMFVLMAEGSATSPLMTMTGMRITTVAVLAIPLLLARPWRGSGRADAWQLTSIGVLDAAANLAYGVATTMGLLVTVAVLGSLYPVVTAVLAAWLLRERLRPVQYVGVAAALAGVLLISASA